MKKHVHKNGKCSNPDAHRDGRTKGARKLIGIYWGTVGKLSQRAKKKVKAVKKAKGIAQAISFARKLKAA